MTIIPSNLIQPGAAFVNGDWTTGASSSFDILDPATQKPIAKVPDLGAKECDNAVAAGIKAFSVLKSKTGKQRGELLKRWFELIQQSQEDIAAIITAENGKPVQEARGEVAYAASFVDWFAGEAPRIDGMVIESSNPANRVVALKQPVGVCGFITPWNFPAAMVTRKVAAALAAGCTCVLKPAAGTPLTALALANLAHQAGFPPGSLSVVTTLEHTVAVGKVLTQHPEIRKFSFTGSTAVGKLLAVNCTSTVKRVSLELGGNAPVVVFDDADLQAAADGIMASKFRLSGQTCVCANRVYVQSGIYDKLASVLVERVKKLRLGPGANAETTIGPLITPTAVDKVDRHVQDAKARGARVLLGGQRAAHLGPAFFEPTILADVPANSICASEETFGPLLPLFKFETEDEAVALANNSESGLAGYLFTRDVSRAWKVGEKIDVGMVGINTGIISDAASPFGGVKASGQGREGSSLGIAEYLEVKSMTFGIA